MLSWRITLVQKDRNGLRYNGNSTSCCLPVWPLYLGFSTAIVTISTTRDPFMKERRKIVFLETGNLASGLDC